MDKQFIEMGNRIKARRKELHIKQSELAELLDISNNHMSSIETGKQKPSLELFTNICEALKVTPDFLLLGNMHAANIHQDIIDSLHLCSKEDLELTRRILEIFVDRNKSVWNKEHFI